MSFWIPRKSLPPQQSSHKERCSLFRSIQLSYNSQVPKGAPTERDTHLPSFLLHLSFKVPGKWAPSMFPSRVRMEREASSPEPMVYSFICNCQESPIRSPPTKTGKIFSHHPRSPTQSEGLHTMGCSLVPQEDRLWHHILYHSAMQPSAPYLPPWLG